MTSAKLTKQTIINVSILDTYIRINFLSKNICNNNARTYYSHINCIRRRSDRQCRHQTCLHSDKITVEFTYLNIPTHFEAYKTIPKYLRYLQYFLLCLWQKPHNFRQYPQNLTIFPSQISSNSIDNFFTIHANKQTHKTQVMCNCQYFIKLTSDIQKIKMVETVTHIYGQISITPQI